MDYFFGGRGGGEGGFVFFSQFLFRNSSIGISDFVFQT